MKLKDFIEALNELTKNQPETLDMDVIYSIDDEGNAYHKVWSGPTIGVHEDNDFIPKEQLEDYERDKSELNAVCIN